MSYRTTQVEIIVFKIVNDKILFLLLKRNKQKGGFWQPITGGVHDGESLADAVKRELLEEIGIKDYIRIYNKIHYFEFDTDKLETLKEYVFGVQIADDTTSKLSPEHTNMKWCTIEKALELLEYDSNKVGFKKLFDLLSA